MSSWLNPVGWPQFSNIFLLIHLYIHVLRSTANFWSSQFHINVMRGKSYTAVSGCPLHHWVYVAAPFFAMLTRMISLRKVQLIGAILSLLGMGLCSVAGELWHVILCFGVLAGIDNTFQWVIDQPIYSTFTCIWLEWFEVSIRITYINHSNISLLSSLICILWISDDTLNRVGSVLYHIFLITISQGF